MLALLCRLLSGNDNGNVNKGLRSSIEEVKTVSYTNYENLAVNRKRIQES